MKISPKIQSQIEYKISQKIKIIEIMYGKKEEKNKQLLETKKQRAIQKAQRDITKRGENQERKAQGKKLKPKKINRDKKMDELRSKYIRLIFPPICYTCGGTEYIGCGHFITCTRRALRWDIRNTRPQGFYCCNSKNTGNGRPIEFEQKLKDEGIDVEELKRIALAKDGKPCEQDIITLYEEVKEKIKKISGKK